MFNYDFKRNEKIRKFFNGTDFDGNVIKFKI